MHFIYHPFGIVLQILALVHLVKRRGEFYWFWIILIGGGLGAIAYMIFEVAPDFALLQQSFARHGRKSQIQQLENAIVDNPSAGNLEDLGEMYWDQGDYPAARSAFDRAISARSDSTHTFYRRGQCALAMRDYPAAIEDLEFVVAQDPKFDFYEAAASLAHAHGLGGDPARADWLFQQIAPHTTNVANFYRYASFLRSQDRLDEAREWAQKLLDRKRTLPRHLQRRERPWFHRAKTMLKELQQPKRG